MKSGCRTWSAKPIPLSTLTATNVGKGGAGAWTLYVTIWSAAPAKEWMSLPTQAQNWTTNPVQSPFPFVSLIKVHHFPRDWGLTFPKPSLSDNQRLSNAPETYPTHDMTNTRDTTVNPTYAEATVSAVPPADKSVRRTCAYMVHCLHTGDEWTRRPIVPSVD